MVMTVRIRTAEKIRTTSILTVANRDFLVNSIDITRGSNLECVLIVINMCVWVSLWLKQHKPGT